MGRKPGLRDALADHGAQAVRRLEIRQLQRGTSQFDQRMHIRAHRAGQVLLLRQVKSLIVEARIDAARVEDFDGIHQRK